MRTRFLFLFITVSGMIHAQDDSLQWASKDLRSGKLYFTPDDFNSVPAIENYIVQGQTTIRSFFRKDYSKPYHVYIFPNRAGLDLQWARDWKQPGFKSECWMIASGVADRVDLLSPRTWDKEACDHNGNDSLEVQQVITHELVHVFHAQQNTSPGFDGIDELSWLIEGLATYASGQLTEEKITAVRNQLVAGTPPSVLADFWKGKLRYQQAGSLIKFIDERFGRDKLISLLELATLPSILNVLAITETDLIRSWADYYK